jgi:DNA-binding NarL/FixJ family response regulator
MSPSRTRVLIVDDHRLFADLIRRPLDERGIQVIDVARDGRRALAVVRDERPDLVLLDLGLRDEYGISVGRRILAAFPDTKLIAVTSYADCQAVKEAVNAGFRAAVTKDTPLIQFVAAIRGVLAGHFLTGQSPHFHEAAVAGARTGGNGLRSPMELLTPREYEVLMLLAKGSSGREMAERLVLSPNTVRTHVQSVLTKLQVHSRIEAAAVALRYGLGNGNRSHPSP